MSDFTRTGWDAERYLRFADQRMRPGFDLLARIPDISPRLIVDLGAGTGELTAEIRRRWPHASVVGIDRSPDMLNVARRSFRQVEWFECDIESWRPDDEIDLIFSNATLHWLDDHESLFRRLRGNLSRRGVIAAQMPDNWRAPTHVIPDEVLATGDWPDAARAAMPRRRLAPLHAYADWVAPAEVDSWRTTYLHRLTGHHPVWTWVTGSTLRPVLASLDGGDTQRFTAECQERYRAAYPRREDGTTVLPFSRFFMVAHAEV